MHREEKMDVESMQPQPEPEPETDDARSYRDFTALTFSGGGARGVFQLGAIEGLEIMYPKKTLSHFTAFGGTSIGALLSIACAFERTAADIKHAIYVSGILSSLNYSVAFQSLLGISKRSQTPMYNAVMKYLKQLEIQPHLTLVNVDRLCRGQWAAIAASFSTGERVVLSSKSFPETTLIEALMASMCIPGVYSARAINGHLLYDGGVVDNIPADLFPDHLTLCLSTDTFANYNHSEASVLESTVRMASFASINRHYERSQLANQWWEVLDVSNGGDLSAIPETASHATQSIKQTVVGANVIYKRFRSQKHSAMCSALGTLVRWLSSGAQNPQSSYDDEQTAPNESNNRSCVSTTSVCVSDSDDTPTSSSRPRLDDHLSVVVVQPLMTPLLCEEMFQYTRQSETDF
jgi:predicted acylesterase/phospholipase RssA